MTNNQQQKLNPQSVEREIDQALAKDNMYLRSVLMIVKTGFIFSILGGIAGWAFALIIPGYFQNVYDATESETWQIAVGLGLTWGMLIGVAISMAALLATAWYRSRIKTTIMQNIANQQQFEEE